MRRVRQRMEQPLLPLGTRLRNGSASGLAWLALLGGIAATNESALLWVGAVVIPLLYFTLWTVGPSAHQPPPR